MLKTDSLGNNQWEVEFNSFTFFSKVYNPWTYSTAIFDPSFPFIHIPDADISAIY